MILPQLPVEPLLFMFRLPDPPGCEPVQCIDNGQDDYRCQDVQEPLYGSQPVVICDDILYALLLLPVYGTDQAGQLIEVKTTLARNVLEHLLVERG